jgi:hypothetical protein
VPREGVQEVGLSGGVYSGDDELADLGSCWDGGISVQKVLPGSPDAARLLEEVIKHCVPLREKVVLQREEKKIKRERESENIDETLASLIFLGRGCC